MVAASMHPTSEWWAAPESEATSLFGSYAQLRNGSHVGFAESAADIREPVRTVSSCGNKTLSKTSLIYSFDIQQSIGTHLFVQGVQNCAVLMALKSFGILMCGYKNC